MASKSLIEQKFFIRWLNFILFPEFKIVDISDLRDGYLLTKLCEILLDIDEEDFSTTSASDSDMSATGKSATSTLASTLGSTTKRKEWAINNITKAFGYCEHIGGDPSGIAGEDILEGKPLAICDFLYKIAFSLYVKDIKVQGVTGEVALLQWVREIAAGILPTGMTSFSGCWNDGYALNIVGMFPEKEADERTITQLKKYTPIERVTVALTNLTDKGVPSVFDPPDIAMGMFTPRCMKLYIGMIYALQNKIPLDLHPQIKKQRDHEEKRRRHRQRKEEERKKLEQQRASKQAALAQIASTSPAGSAMGGTTTSGNPGMGSHSTPASSGAMPAAAAYAYHPAFPMS